MKTAKKLYLILFYMFLITFIKCTDDDVPPEENEEEIIDLVTLTFTPKDKSKGTVMVSATDPDGEGIKDFITDTINLKISTEYKLTVKLENKATNENITEEIENEKGEHQFFFGFTSGLFSNPAGDGNIDGRENKAINYNDTDENGLPVGLVTTWNTVLSAQKGTFRTILKHQPDIKTATSTIDVGESDIDITWRLNVKD